jgi:hypothetical protein
VAPLFEQAAFVRDLKEHRFWSLEWVSSNGVEGPFEYVVLRKREGGGYDHFGTFETATLAFEARRGLVSSTGETNYFLRCKRVPQVFEVVGPEHPESREDLDRWRDVYRTGDEGLLNEEELPAYRDWCARLVNTRSYARDLPF